MKNTIILATAKGYNPEQLEPWVNSLKKSGFKGNTYVFLYENNSEVEDYLKNNGINFIHQNDTGLTHVATQRFKDYATFLRSEECAEVDYVLHTDIRDVVFQSDPAKWIKENIGEYQIIASGEGVTYNHEDWNGDGLQYHFGKETFDKYSNYETMCSGVIAGTRKGLTFLFETMYEIAFYSKDIAGFIDQHFYNIALREVFADVTKFVSPKESWNANLGTIAAIPMRDVKWSTSGRTPYNSYERFRKGTYIENMLCLPAKIVAGTVMTQTGEPYVIVHQYDRCQSWVDDILLHYVKKKTSIKESDTTIVTALYDLNRGNWEGFERSFNHYKSWLQQLLTFDNKLVIYVDEADVDFVLECRRGKERTTQVIAMSADDFYVNQKWGNSIRSVMAMPEFRKGQTAIGHPQIEKPEYNILMHEKVQFVKKAIENNFFNTEHYMWLDAGVYHIENRIDLIGKKYKINPKFLDDKIHFIAIDEPKHEDSANLEKFYKGHNVRIIGTSWLGHKNAILNFAKTYEKLIDDSLSLGLMDQDQSFLTVSYLRDPHICKVHKGNWKDAINLWDRN